jgi:hypothetical protein
MLKPRYRTVKEAIKDFKSSLKGMDEFDARGPGVLFDRQAEELTESAQPLKKEERSAATPQLPRHLEGFRKLAGLTEREDLPWDSGIGNTKHAETLMDEADILERMMHAADTGSGKSYLGAEKMHQRITANHYAKQHAILHSLPHHQRAAVLQKMAGERQRVAGWLLAASKKAHGNGDHDAASRLRKYAIAHAHAAKKYSAGHMLDDVEEWPVY